MKVNREHSTVRIHGIETVYQVLVRGEDSAQYRLDAAILDAIDAEIDAGALQEAKASLVQERLSND